jgi:hypothetical protein
MIKYYFRVDSINENKPLTLYYVNYSDYSEKRFDNKTNTWVPSDKIYYAVISGDMDYEEATLEQAKEFAPEAFKKVEKDGK